MNKPILIDRLSDIRMIEARAIAHSYNKMCMDFIYPLMHKSKLFQDIVMRRKKDDDKEKYQYEEFGYYHNEGIYQLLEILEHFRVRSMVDLGCGPNIICSAAHEFIRQLRTGGYDNEPAMQKVFGRNNIVTKDITVLKWADIESYDALYFYEPLISDRLCNKFAVNLDNIIPKGESRMLIYRAAGYMGRAIQATGRFRLITEHNSYDIYQTI